MARTLGHYRRLAQVAAEYGKPPEIMLTELYVLRGLSEAQVGQVLHVSQRAVHTWLVKHHIPRRHAHWAFDRVPQEAVR